MDILKNLRNKLDNRRESVLANYRKFVAKLAEARSLTRPESDALTDALSTLGLSTNDLTADIKARRTHDKLTALAAQDDADVLGEEARTFRQAAEEHRAEARSCEQRALALDGQLRGLAERRHELVELERFNPRLFASDIDLALAGQPKPEPRDRPPEPAGVTDLVVAQHAERTAWPPVAAGGASR